MKIKYLIEGFFTKYSPGNIFRSISNLDRIQIDISLLQKEVAQIQTEITSTRQEVLQIQTEIADLRQEVLQIQAGNSSVGKEVTEIQSRISEMVQQIAEVSSVSNNLTDQMQGFRKSFLATRYHSSRTLDGTMPPAAALQDRGTFAEQLKQLEALAPGAFSIWYPLLEVNSQAYIGAPLDSCSVAGHAVATLFRFFISPYLKGRVLDIGCGPQPVPFYLDGYPLEAIYGIDPLSESKNHPFKFIKGFAEFLPWNDHQFNLVVAATSLDHVLLLDKTFEEIKRSLTSDGFFAVWDGFIPGSKFYDPYSPELQAVDQYHLFHFDRQSFLDAIKPFFYIFEEYIIDTQSIFFILRPK